MPDEVSVPQPMIGPASCPTCASAVAPSDEFCQECGSRLRPAATPPTKPARSAKPRWLAPAVVAGALVLLASLWILWPASTISLADLASQGRLHCALTSTFTDPDGHISSQDDEALDLTWGAGGWDAVTTSDDNTDSDAGGWTASRADGGSVTISGDSVAESGELLITGLSSISFVPGAPVQIDVTSRRTQESIDYGVGTAPAVDTTSTTSVKAWVAGDGLHLEHRQDNASLDGGDTLEISCAP